LPNDAGTDRSQAEQGFGTINTDEGGDINPSLTSFQHEWPLIGTFLIRHHQTLVLRQL